MPVLIDQTQSIGSKLIWYPECLVKVGSNWYVGIVSGQLATGCTFQFHKSTDNGLTWSAALDALNAPSYSHAQLLLASYDPVFCFDGSATLTVCYVTTIVGGGDGNLNIELRPFDTGSDTWGAAFGNVSTPTMSTPQGLYYRPDTSILVIGQHNGPGSTSQPQAASYLGGAWSTATDLEAFQPFINPQDFRAVIDPATGILHSFHLSNNVRVIYRQVLADNSLGNTTTFPDLVNPPAWPGLPRIWNGNVVFPYCIPDGAQTSPAMLYVGTPLTAPVWTLVNPIDPGYPADPTLIIDYNGLSTGPYNGFAAVDGGVLQYAYSASDSQLRVIQTTNADPSLGWTGRTLLTDLITQILNPVPFNVGNSAVYRQHITNQVELFGLQNAVPLSIAGTFGPGREGVSYSACSTVSGGTPPYSFVITAGTIPPGTTLDAATGCITSALGPTVSGVFCFTLTVTDALAATASISACITIFGSILLTFYGWKVYPEDPCALPDQEAPIPPNIKRAM